MRIRISNLFAIPGEGVVLCLVVVHNVVVVTSEKIGCVKSSVNMYIIYR